MAYYTMKNSFVKLFFNPAGDLIVPTPKVETPAGSGIIFRPSLGVPWREIVAYGLTGISEEWVISAWTGTAYSNNINGLFITSYGSGNGDGTDLQRTFKAYAKKSASPPTTVLEITQVVTLANTGSGELDKLIKFDVSIKNISATPVSGVTYLRSIGARQGWSYPTTGSLLYDLDAHYTNQKIWEWNNNYTSAKEYTINFYPSGGAIVTKIANVGFSDPNQVFLGLGSRTPGARMSLWGASDTNRLKTTLTSVATSGYFEWDGTTLAPCGTYQITPDYSLGHTYYTPNLWFDKNVIPDPLPAGASADFSFHYILYDDLTSTASSGVTGTVSSSGTIFSIAPGIILKSHTESIPLNSRYNGRRETTKISANLTKDVYSLYRNSMFSELSTSSFDTMLRDIQKYRFKIAWITTDKGVT